MRCPHRWCVRNDGRNFVRASCGVCGLIVLNLVSWCEVDQEAAFQFVDPNHYQRNFLFVSGLEPKLAPSLSMSR